tara:strand:- start:15584 stop:15952 length:369 start_codon:yes stop_codon:yes gene_type:complete
LIPEQTDSTVLSAQVQLTREEGETIWTAPVETNFVMGINTDKQQLLFMFPVDIDLKGYIGWSVVAWRMSIPALDSEGGGWISVFSDELKPEYVNPDDTILSLSPTIAQPMAGSWQQRSRRDG